MIFFTSPHTLANSKGPFNSPNENEKSQNRDHAENIQRIHFICINGGFYARLQEEGNHLVIML